MDVLAGGGSQERRRSAQCTLRLKSLEERIVGGAGAEIRNLFAASDESAPRDFKRYRSERVECTEPRAIQPDLREAETSTLEKPPPTRLWTCWREEVLKSVDARLSAFTLKILEERIVGGRRRD